jgi:hypothetical protein
MKKEFMQSNINKDKNMGSGIENIQGTYSVIKKEWRWLDVIRDLNTSCFFRLISSWMFDSVLQIKFHSTGKEGVLFVFDENQWSSLSSFYELCFDKAPVQMRVEVLKSIFVHFFHADVFVENGMMCYFFENKNIHSITEELNKRLSYPDKSHFATVDGNAEYPLLFESDFTKNGFDDRLSYFGFYDRFENKIKFTIQSENTLCGHFVPEKYIKLFNGKECMRNVAYRNELGCSLEDFPLVCKLLL